MVLSICKRLSGPHYSRVLSASLPLYMTSSISTQRRFCSSSGSSDSVFVTPSGGPESGPLSLDEWLDKKDPIMRIKDLRYKLRKQRRDFMKFRQEAEEAGKPIDVICASVIERWPIVMPSFEEWEIDFLELTEAKKLWTHKWVDSHMLKGHVDDIPKMRQDDAWVFEHLEMGTNGRLGPNKYDEFLISEKKRLAEERLKQDEMTTKREQDAKGGGVSSDLLDLDYLVDDDDADEIDYEMATGEAKRENRNESAIFKPEPRITEADESNDQRSTRRSLARRLHLIVKVQDENGSGPAWRFPYGLHGDVDGERLMFCAKRRAHEMCGGEMDLFYLTKRCAGMNYFKYSEERSAQRNGAYGVHVVFYRAQRILGLPECEKNPDILDYAWIRSDELAQFVPDYSEDPYWWYAQNFLDD